jgi:hypothetical protein
MACTYPHCKESSAKSKCTRCKYTRYCSKQCQQLDWKQHKILCEETPDLPKTTRRRRQSTKPGRQPEWEIIQLRKELIAYNRLLANGVFHCMLCGDDVDLRRLRKIGIQCVRCLVGGARRGLTITNGTKGLVGVAGVEGGPFDLDSPMDLDLRVKVLTHEYHERRRCREVGGKPPAPHFKQWVDANFHYLLENFPILPHVDGPADKLTKEDFDYLTATDPALPLYYMHLGYMATLFSEMVKLMKLEGITTIGGPHDLRDFIDCAGKQSLDRWAAEAGVFHYSSRGWTLRIPKRHK